MLEHSAAGVEVTAYHLEAAIAATHVSARRLEDTDWSAIVALYDRLLRVAPSPVVALNRAIAVGQRDGAEHGLRELQAITGRERLASYPFYPAALGEFELCRGNRVTARRQFESALALARNDAERRFLAKRVFACSAGGAKN